MSTTTSFTGENFQWYLIGARLLDPDIGMWISTDPMMEYYNSYSYVGGNPINAIDPNGMETWIFTDDNGTITDRMYFDNDNFDVTVLSGNSVISDFAGAELRVMDNYFFSNDIIGAQWVGNFSSDIMWREANESMMGSGQWGSGKFRDFKNTHAQNGKYDVGIAWGKAMTSRDVGNAMWGSWMNRKVPILGSSEWNVHFISNTIAGGNGEDARSWAMQRWGYNTKAKY